MLIRHQTRRCSSVHFFIRMPAASLLTTAALMLSACGGGGGGGSAAPTSTASASSAASSAATSSSSSSSVSASLLYAADPSIANCNAGQLKDSERTTVLNAVNAIRARHGLLPVTYDPTDNNAAANAALYMVANMTLTGVPSSSGRCFTIDGANFAAGNIISLAAKAAATTQDVPSAQFLSGFLVSLGGADLGSRRLLLNPFLGATTFGRVDGQPVGSSLQYVSTSLRVRGGEISDVSAMSNDFVAYPYGIYPAGDFNTGWYLSFSAIASKTNAAANGSGQVSFAGATITVTDGVTPLTVTDQAASYVAYGLPNSLQWRVTGLQNNVTYAVRIDNVIVNGVTRQYNYNFRLQ